MVGPDIDDHEATVIRVATIIALGVILLASVIGLTVTAVMTDRNLIRAEALTFGGVVVLAAIGGFSWSMFRRRRHWRFQVNHEEGAD